MWQIASVFPEHRVGSHFLLQSIQRTLDICKPRCISRFHSALSRAFQDAYAPDKASTTCPLPVIFACVFLSTCRDNTLHSSPGAAHSKICTTSPEPARSHIPLCLPPMEVGIFSSNSMVFVCWVFVIVCLFVLF